MKSLLISVEKEACENSFYEFVKSFWDVIVTEPFQDNWHIKYICEELQYLEPFLTGRQNKPYDLVINIPPGTTKTTIVMQMYHPWLWTKDQTIRIISSSHSEGLSIESAIKSRDILKSTKYRLFWPNVALRKDKSAKKAFENTKGGTRDVTSTGSSITGRHSHIKLMDDLQDISKADSEADRIQAINHMKTLFTREVRKGHSINVLIMQRLHELDCTNYLLSLAGGKRKIKHICIPATLKNNNGSENTILPANLKAYYKDGLMDIVRMNYEVLSTKMIELGTLGYSSQFDQNPTPPEGNILKRSWFKIIPRELYLPSTNAVQFFLDTAYEEKKKIKKSTGEASNDPTGLLSTRLGSNGVCYIEDYREVYLELPDLIKFIKIWAMSKGYTNRSFLRIEPKASGKSTIQSVKTYTKLNVKEIEILNHKGKKTQKDSKITEVKNASPAVEAGRFVLVQGDWNEKFLERVCGFPNSAHDEAADVLCYAKRFYFGVERDLSKVQEALQKAQSLLS